MAMDIKASLEKYSSVANPKSLTADASHQALQAGEIRNPKQILNPKHKTNCHSREGGNLLIVDPRVKPEDDKLKKLQADIIESISLIMGSKIDYEFRTTVCHPYHTIKDFEEIGKLIKGAKRYFIQNFVKSKQVNTNQNYQPFSDQELKKAAKEVEKFVKKVDIR